MKRKSLSLAMLAIQDVRYGEAGERQAACCRRLCVREVIAGELKGRSTLVAGIFCQQRCCPMCSHRRAVATMRAYLPKVQGIADENQGYEFHMLVGTVRARRDKAGAYAAVDETLKRWTATVQKAHKRGTGPLARIVGGLATIEVKECERPNEGMWHVHVHVLLVVDGRPDYSAIDQAWVKASAGESEYARTVPLYAEKRRMKGLYARGSEAFRLQLGRDLAEVIKYPLKPPDIDSVDVFEWAALLKGKRLLRPFGCLVGVDVPESLVDEPLKWDELEWLDRWFCYSTTERAYCETQPPRMVPAEGSEVAFQGGNDDGREAQMALREDSGSGVPAGALGAGVDGQADARVRSPGDFQVGKNTREDSGVGRGVLGGPRLADADADRAQHSELSGRQVLADYLGSLRAARPLLVEGVPKRLLE